MKERHQRSTHRSTQISPEYHPGISAQPMIPESARAEFWPTTSPRRVGLASCARGGAEGSFLCSPSSGTSKASAVNWTRLSCHRFRGNEVRLWLSVIAYSLGNLWRRLVLQ